MPVQLNTDKPLRLIGIQIFEDTLSGVRKSLEAGWYPFMKCQEIIGTSRNQYPKVDNEVCPKAFYEIAEGLPRITITAIAGKNGAGKSTLLDILYRILNNFAETILGKEERENGSIGHSAGLHARLHFEQDGVQRFIEISDGKETVYAELVDGKPVYQKTEALTDKERNVLLNRFFYTISVNYSLYSLNPKDSGSAMNETDEHDGDWLNYLFHKNDGYYIPLVLTPFRVDGNVDVNNENTLAEQRISVLSLLFHSQKKEFLDDYVPHRLCYEFDKDYKSNKMKSFRRKLREELKPCIDVIISHFEQAWQKYFDEEGIELDPDRQEIELFYLAYKSVKICLTYPEYVELFELEDLLGIAKTYAEHFGSEGQYTINKTNGRGEEQKVVGAQDCVKWMNEHTDNVKKVVAALLQDNGRHITSKIFQTLSYIQGARYKQGKSISADELTDRRYETYDEVMALMPPPFFKAEMHYKKSNDKSDEPKEISLKSFSSGERQLLYSLSYICYHIKNIASNKKDGKRVVGYHHINLIFDEAELYYHPEFQRQFVKKLLERLAMCHINRTNIRSVNIMIVTHSPFILSDIPETNVLYLGTEEGHTPGKTFGANIYDLLKDSFFLDLDIGDVAQTKIDELVGLYQAEKSNKAEKRFLEQYDEMEYIIRHMGEDYLRKSYEYMFVELQKRYVPDRMKQQVREQLERLEEERKRLMQILEA